MSTLHTRPAHLKDTDALSRLINRAFIAESPWVSGERINPDGVRELIFKGVFLLGENNGALLACVYIERRGSSAHIGLVSVDPDHQHHGLGSQIMSAAEAHCRDAGYHDMELRFINHRAELQNFYSRCGYIPTGKIEAPDPTRMKIPFHFVQMVKTLI
jgi:GNAT superfamily N-acetyltransferase